MLVLFVHGMGRTPLSGWPMLRRLRRGGLGTTTFGYTTIFESFDSITLRLVSRLSEVAATGPYVVVGHSLGGVLLRAALDSLPKDVTRPRHVFLLGSPIQPSRLARRLKDNLLFRVIAGDCGQLLGSSSRMNAIGALSEPATGVAGVRGLSNRRGPFGEEPNDGIVSVGEVSASWLSNQIWLPVIHTLLPASRLVAEVILHELGPEAG